MSCNHPIQHKPYPKYLRSVKMNELEYLPLSGDEILRQENINEIIEDRISTYFHISDRGDKGLISTSAKRIWRRGGLEGFKSSIWSFCGSERSMLVSSLCSVGVI